MTHIELRCENVGAVSSGASLVIVDIVVIGCSPSYFLKQQLYRSQTIFTRVDWVNKPLKVIRTSSLGWLRETL